MDEFRARLTGTWSMISFNLHPPGQPSESQPFYSPEATGFLMYSSDGFMLCLIHEPDGSNLHSYGGPVSIAREGDQFVVTHHVKASIPLARIGSTQRRMPSFSEEDGEEQMTITAEPQDIKGEKVIAVVRWKRAKEVYKLDV